VVDTVRGPVEIEVGEVIEGRGTGFFGSLVEVQRTTDLYGGRGNNDDDDKDDGGRRRRIGRECRVGGER